VITVIRVVVVDDEPMVWAHLRTILGSAADIEVVDEAHDGAVGVEAVLHSKPDVVLMDLRMPGVDGITAIERIGKLAHPPVIVVLTTFDADQYVLRALRAGRPASWSSPRPRKTSSGSSASPLRATRCCPRPRPGG
jgi:DNA-binding NarL/FixJ family response regulator